MNASRDATGQDRGQSSRQGKIIAVAMLIALAMIVASLGGLSLFGRAALDQEVETIVATGEPLTLAALRARLPDVPPDRNSAIVLLGLLERLQPPSPDDARSKLLPLLGYSNNIAWGETWPAETVEAIGEYLADQSDTLSALDAVHDMPSGRFPIEFDPSKPVAQQWWPGGEQRIGSAVRFAVKLEVLAALNDALHGSPARALERVETAVNIGASLAQDAMLVSSLTVVALDNLAVTTAETILAMSVVDTQRLLALETLFSRAEDLHVMALGLRGERVMARAMIADARSGRLDGGNGPTSARDAVYAGLSWVAGGWFDRNEAKVLELFAPIIEANDRPEEALDAARKLDQKLDKLSRFYLLATMTLPGLERITELWARHDARLRCARAALAAERFRLDTGRWPDELDALVPTYLNAVPIDPFDGSPVRYVRRDGGIAVYSIGADEHDDGGNLAAGSGTRKRPPDVGFRLAAPGQRTIRIAVP